ncbi:hypothetical protein [Algoriphagus sp.]|uniref:hypothetical protein n=1 Tax=Algoriphagus sp. TaxID=1872435 RepID=UPI003F718949
MTIKITIAKDSKAAKAVKALVKQKKELRKAVENGTAEEYVKKNRARFAKPV